MRLSAYVAPALTGLFLVTAAQAQTTPAGQANAASHDAAKTAVQSRSGSLSAMDKTFLQQVAQGADYELTLAKLAEQKATKQDVKQYARTIVRDHEKLNSSLHQLAQEKGVQLSPQMDAQQQEKVSSLKRVSGEAFNRAYAAEMARINGQDRTDLKKEIDATQDPDVKTFAQQMQVADAKHQEMGQKLENRG